MNYPQTLTQAKTLLQQGHHAQAVRAADDAERRLQEGFPGRAGRAAGGAEAGEVVVVRERDLRE